MRAGLAWTAPRAHGRPVAEAVQVTYLGGLLGLTTLALWIYCVIDVVTTPGHTMRNLPKPAWLLLVVFLPPFGPLAWLGLGRARVDAGGDLPSPGPRRGGGATAVGRGPWVPGPTATTRPTRPGRSSHPVAPDDDPDFLAGLHDAERKVEREAERAADAEHERVLKDWEADLRRREDELRRRDDGGPETVDPAPR